MDGMSFKQARPDEIKETHMFNMKTLLKAASLAVLTAAGLGAGLGTASAAPWDHRYDRDRYDRYDRFDRYDHRGWDRYDRMDRRAFVGRWRVADALRFHRFRVTSDPFFLHGRYVVRVHDRFGRPVLVQVNPYTGAFIRVL
jgi:hypothetical protein